MLPAGGGEEGGLPRAGLEVRKYNERYRSLLEGFLRNRRVAYSFISALLCLAHGGLGRKRDQKIIRRQIISQSYFRMNLRQLARL